MSGTGPRRPASGGALLVAGTTSDAGKSVVTAGICRWLVRQGVSVAPFKAQNMSNNSMVTLDGAEIGRAQVMQAAAARVEPEAAMNPVLLKPGGEDSSQVVVLGRAVADVTALSYRPMKAALLEQVLASLEDLRARFDVVVCEGAGSPTEINLRADDIANMGLATAAGLPVVVVGDIDRGGVFPALYGTVALMPPADQRLVAGFLVNKFRGDVRLLAPGLDRLTALTGRPTLGVLPWLAGAAVDVEDSLGVPTGVSSAGPPRGEEVLRVAVARLPRLSNFTDLDALAAEPGVLVRYATTPEELADADLVVLPGTRATVADLGWLRATGLADAVVRHAAAGRAVLGVCGGHQMLARTITDDVESRAGTVPGLGLLPADVRFLPEKVLGRPSGSAFGEPVRGYEIHHGRVVRSGDAPLIGPEGSETDRVWGTHWHGLLENDGFRRRLLQRVGRDGFVVAPDTCFADERTAQLDLLGDLVEQNLDVRTLEHVISHGAARDLPVVTSGLAVSPG
jgi:adenosylcobyric acid synthase